MRCCASTASKLTTSSRTGGPGLIVFTVCRTGWRPIAFCRDAIAPLRGDCCSSASGCRQRGRATWSTPSPPWRHSAISSLPAWEPARAVDAIQQEFPAAVRSRVSVLPRVDREQLYEQLRLADVFVFPTLSEGFSCALLEAMAAELPVVTTPVGAAVDFIDSGQNGVLVPCADVTALVAAVARMGGDAQARAALGLSARQTATRFTVRASCLDFAARVYAVAHRDATSRPDVMVRSDAA